MSPFAALPAPPYYVVIFTSTRTEGENGYDTIADRMVELAAQQPGYLGVESTRGDDGFGVTLSYWKSLEAIANWKRNSEHLEAQRRGHADWYAHFELKIAKVERAYGGPKRKSGTR